MIKNEKKLDGVEEELVHLIDIVSSRYPTIILEGFRSKERQKELIKNGKSKKEDSKHLDGMAVDRSPYPIPFQWGHIDLELIPEETRKIIMKQVRELCKFYHYCGYELGVADHLGIKIRQGCDWDGDKEFNDQLFHDLVHVELK